MKRKLSAISISMVLLLLSCQQDESPTGQTRQTQQAQQAHRPSPGAGAHTVVVQEVVQASSYTYLKVKEADNLFWVAVIKGDVKIGQTISFADALEMKNFTSKELDRTFETIYFVNKITDGSSPSTGARSMAAGHQIKPVAEKTEISVEPAEGGITIGELFSKRDSYSGKTVLIRGRVTKVNRGIMGMNWLHLQDGTSHSGDFDLTATTLDDAAVGEIVTLEGKITLNRDFGSGYSYAVIMEQAKRKTE